MASEILFYDNDGRPVGLGEEVCIHFVVVGAKLLKSTDRFLTVTLQLKHDTHGMKFKVDDGQLFHTVPSCMIVKT